MNYQLSDQYEMSQKAVAEKMFLNEKTIISTEKRAIQNFKIELAKRGISIKDLLED